MSNDVSQWSFSGGKIYQNPFVKNMFDNEDIFAPHELSYLRHLGHEKVVKRDEFGSELNEVLEEMEPKTEKNDPISQDWRKESRPEKWTFRKSDDWSSDWTFDNTDTFWEEEDFDFDHTDKSWIEKMIDSMNSL